MTDEVQKPKRKMSKAKRMRMSLGMRKVWKKRRALERKNNRMKPSDVVKALSEHPAVRAYLALLDLGPRK